MSLRGNGSLRQSILELKIEDWDIVSDFIKELQSQQKHSSKKGAWQLVETWHHCKRQISPKEDLVDLSQQWGKASSQTKKFQLMQVTNPTHKTYKEKVRRIRMKRALISQPQEFLKNKWSHRRLHCTKWVMKQALRQSRKRYSNMLLNRIVQGDPLWGPLDSTPLDSLRAELSTKKEKNLLLSLEIADLNIQSTRLRNETHPLRQKEQELLKRLTQLQEEVNVKREEKEKRGPRDLNQVQADIIKLRRELEARNRLNATHTSKLKAQKELLMEKRKILEEKQRELEILKQQPLSPVTVAVWQGHKDTTQQVKVEEPDLPSLRQPASPKDQNDFFNVPFHSKQETKSPASRKRHASKFEAKTKHLVEEEGMSFRKMHKQIGSSEIKSTDSSKLKSGQNKDLFPSTDLTTYQKSAIHLHTEGPDVLVIPKEDVKWYESQTSQDVVQYETRSQIQTSSQTSSQSDSGQPKIKTKTAKKAQFAKEALILNAALEGDLKLLKECVKELGSCSYASDKGATCLHNAVCSGNLEMVEFLVKMGCDINAQDIDGWTPLHCAAAYRNLSMIQFLVQTGSSLFLTTQDGDTPLKIAIEEYEVDREGQSESEQGSDNGKKKGNPQMAVECLHYLMDTQTNLGVSNQGKVYALFSRTSTESDELSIGEGESLIITDRGEQGEQWWLAQNVSGQTGLVPCTFLGPHYRHSVIL